MRGRIVETEAYHYSEPACHAHVGVTPRTHVLLGAPGTAYVYRSYGIHALLNAVCEPEGVGAAVLIRALEPLWGVELMRARRGPAPGLTNGPGKLTQALGIELGENGTSLVSGPIRIYAGEPLPYVTGPRIGITKAAELPWRFCAVARATSRSPGRRACCAGARQPVPSASPGRRRGLTATSRHRGRWRRGRSPAACVLGRRRRRVLRGGVVSCGGVSCCGAGRRPRRRRRSPGGAVVAAGGAVGAGGGAVAGARRSASALGSRSLPVPSPPSFLGSGSYFSSDSMNVFQIPAGYVPPATGSPWNSVFIGLNSSG